jgi:hypothetical protein
MREGEIDSDKILGLLDHNMAGKSRGLMEIVEKEGAQQIADMLSRF